MSWVPAESPQAPLLSAQGLVRHFVGGGLFNRSRSRVQAVNGVTIHIDSAETLGLVGESGCGKSTLARLLGLLDVPDQGHIQLAGTEVARLAQRQLKSFRRRVQMVFQDPFASLNPRLSIAAILAEPLLVHGVGNRVERQQRSAELMAAVGLDPAQLNRYPHEFSGGQRQRIAIARALALEPDLIIADEPLSALDVSIQSQILNLLMELKEQRNLAYLFISHDLAVVSHIADRVAVMYAGRIVETAARADLFQLPAHPYTSALIAASPVIRLGGKSRSGMAQGEATSALQSPPGCPYHPRCPRAQAVCREKLPDLQPLADRSPTHQAACHFPEVRWR